MDEASEALRAHVSGGTHCQGHGGIEWALDSERALCASLASPKPQSWQRGKRPQLQTWEAFSEFQLSHFRSVILSQFLTLETPVSPSVKQACNLGGGHRGCCLRSVSTVPSVNGYD